MKRLYVAAVLLAAVVGLCATTHLSHHRQIDRLLGMLSRVEEHLRRGDGEEAVQAAEEFAAEYQRFSRRISLYVPHGDIQDSAEAAALLPTLIRTDRENEPVEEIARLRAQLQYLRQVDDPTLRNIL